MLTTTEQYLQRTSPESQGIASAAILQFVEALDTQIKDIHSVMLLRHGCVVAEGWWSPYERQHPHMMFSLSKSFTSSAVGLAITEGLFSLDDTVLSFFPDETRVEVNEHLAAMRIRHLLSMSTGHANDTTSFMFERGDGNWTKVFFEVPVEHEPGTHFLYNTGATYILSAIIQKTTGMKLIDYLQPRLFEPLGIEHPTWDESPEGINAGGFGLNARTEDIAKFGQLYLQKGMWQGRQILPEAWIDEATAFHISNGADVDSDWNQGYGYQFWRCRHNAYRGDGAFGQYCVVMPEQDVVLAITGGVDDMQQPLSLLWDILLPAMHADSLPDDPEAHETLQKKLSSLRVPPVQGEAQSTLLSQVSGQTYKFDPNDLQLETITLSFHESGCTLKLNTAAGEQTIPCGYGTWQQGQTTLFNEFWEMEPKPVVTSGAWTADDTCSMVIRLYETPFYHRLVFHFAADQIMVETRINLSFETIKTHLLTARLQ